MNYDDYDTRTHPQQHVGGALLWSVVCLHIWVVTVMGAAAGWYTSGVVWHAVACATGAFTASLILTFCAVSWALRGGE